jgi:hypothetical protein
MPARSSHIPHNRERSALQKMSADQGLPLSEHNCRNASQGLDQEANGYQPRCKVSHYACSRSGIKGENSALELNPCQALKGGFRPSVLGVLILPRRSPRAAAHNRTFLWIALSADRADRHHCSRAVDPCGENRTEPLGNEFRTSRLRIVPSSVWHDLSFEMKPALPVVAELRLDGFEQDRPEAFRCAVERESNERIDRRIAKHFP